MAESKLITLLRTLDKDEMRRFGKFLEGTAERKAPGRMAFFDYLQKHHPEFPEKKVKPEHVAQKLFPKDKKGGKKIDNLKVKMVELVEDFLVYEELKVQQSKRDFLLLEAYKRRKLDDFFFKKIKKIEQKWERKKPEGIEQLNNKYLLKKMYPTNSKYTPLDKILDIAYQFDKYYFATKLYLTLCYIAQGNFVNPNKETVYKKHLFSQKNLDIFTQMDFQITPQIELLSNLVQAFTSMNFQNYAEIKSLFMSNLNLYNEDEKSDILYFLTIICDKKQKQGNQEAARELFELNKDAVENKLIFENGRIPSGVFKNIVNIACATGNIDWAEAFVDNYSKFLHLREEDAKNIIKLCEAVIDFYKGDYTEAVRKLQIIRFQDFFDNAHVRSLILQCYYELDHERFYEFASSFRNFLNRNDKIAEQIKEAFFNFISFTIKLKKAREKYRPDVETLASEIEHTDNVVHKKWLLSKLKESR